MKFYYKYFIVCLQLICFSDLKAPSIDPLCLNNLIAKDFDRIGQEDGNAILGSEYSAVQFDQDKWYIIDCESIRFYEKNEKELLLIGISYVDSFTTSFGSDDSCTVSLYDYSGRKFFFKFTERKNVSVSINNEKNFISSLIRQHWKS